MDSGGIPGDWTPPPAPPVGSSAWKSDMALKQVTGMLAGLPRRSAVFKLMRCAGHELGYMVVRYNHGSGWDYFRVDEIEDIYESANAPR